MIKFPKTGKDYVGIEPPITRSVASSHHSLGYQDAMKGEAPQSRLKLFKELDRRWRIYCSTNYIDGYVTGLERQKEDLRQSRRWSSS